jgi:adsorption protein B
VEGIADALAYGAALVGDLIGRVADWFTPEALFQGLVAYWFVLKVTVAIVAILVFVSSIDDLVIDFFYWDLTWRERWRRTVKPPPSQEMLRRHPEKRIALMVPAWQESDVIASMVANTTNTFEYERFHIFVGCYVNDPDTIREVERVRQRFPNVHRAEVPHDGPTSKADCLNWLIQNIFLYEQKTGERFDVILMHDAEDVVHPFGLKTVNWFIEGQGMIQLPVLSMNRRWHRLVACHYMDEFAEVHNKDLRVRSHLARMTPSAGVATAFSREAMAALCRDNADQPFNTDSLTEDYDVGHRLRGLGFKSTFVRYFAKTVRYREKRFGKGKVAVVRKELVATKEFFPDRVQTAVRQKARWMLGISYMGWRQLGWFGDLANRYFLFRDRKALFTAPTGALAYLIVLQYFGYQGVTWIFPQAARLPPLVDRQWVWVLIQINFIFLLNRLFHRAWFTWRAHGKRYVWLTPVRVVVSNFIGFGSFMRSMRLFLTHVLTGRTIGWDKTQHAFPSLAQIAHARGLLGDVLRFWNHVDVNDLDAALEEQKRRYRPIGRLLVDRGALEDVHLAEAFAERAETTAVQIDAFGMDPEARRMLTPREAARFGALPWRWNGPVLEVALAEPLDKADRAELEKLLDRRGAKAVSWRYAPLSDVAFAVRYGWEPPGFERARSTAALLKKLAMLDASGEAALWRSVRRDYARLGDLLVRAGAIDHRTLETALEGFWAADAPLGAYLVARGVVSPEAVTAALEDQKLEPIDVLGRAVDLGLMGAEDAARLHAPQPAPA